MIPVEQECILPCNCWDQKILFDVYVSIKYNLDQVLPVHPPSPIFTDNASVFLYFKYISIMSMQIQWKASSFFIGYR
jgi:hypothetical protein